MKITGIKYIAPLFDHSGYAQASRGYVTALHELGVPLTLAPISFEKYKSDLGPEYQFMYDLVDNDIDYNVVIVHTTPEFWHKFKESGRIMVGYTIWETSRLHPSWPEYINTNVDKVLVGCEWNVGVFKDSGVTIPIGCVPHVINDVAYKDAIPYEIDGVSDDTYVFYSIFQFTERKHPTALIKAYWSAFQDNENVALILKTYRNDYSDPEKDIIRATLKRMKNDTIAKCHPPIYAVLDMLSREQILGLHKRGDCYVSLDRGEGFGLSPAEGGVIGNPIIVTGYGGVTEYAKPDNSYLVPYVLTPVFGMPYSPWYRLDQSWAEPGVVEAANIMKHVYDHREEAKEKGRLLKEYICDNFSVKAIGNRMISEIEDIKVA